MSQNKGKRCLSQKSTELISEQNADDVYWKYIVTVSPEQLDDVWLTISG